MMSPPPKLIHIYTVLYHILSSLPLSLPDVVVLLLTVLLLRSYIKCLNKEIAELTARLDGAKLDSHQSDNALHSTGMLYLTPSTAPVCCI